MTTVELIANAIQDGVKKKILIVGHGGSGKDYLFDKLKSMGIKPTVSNTTRPQREGEIPGVTYNYRELTEFQQMILRKEFWQWKVYSVKVDDKPESWYYGTTKESWNNDQLFIITPPAVKEDIAPEMRKQCYIVYLNIDEAIRRERLGKRNDADSVDRRIHSDDELFEGFTDYDIMITDPAFK